MTNLQQGVTPRSGALRNGLLIGLPIAGGLVLAGIVLLGGVFQPWSQLRRDQLQIDELRGMEQRLPLLRAQRLRQIEEVDTLEKQQASLLQLIAGSGELRTFLAQLNREAASSGVRLDVFEPTTADVNQQPSADKGDQNPPPPDPLEAPGLGKTTVLLSVRGAYPNLLVFLRRLERLSLLVAQSDLNLELEELTQESPRQGSAASPGPSRIPRVVLKLNLSLYGKAAPAPAPTAPATAPQAPAATKS